MPLFSTGLVNRDLVSAYSKFTVLEPTKSYKTQNVGVAYDSVPIIVKIAIEDEIITPENVVNGDDGATSESIVESQDFPFLLDFAKQLEIFSFSLDNANIKSLFDSVFVDTLLSEKERKELKSSKKKSSHKPKNQFLTMAQNLKTKNTDDLNLFIMKVLSSMYPSTSSNNPAVRNLYPLPGSSIVANRVVNVYNKKFNLNFIHYLRACGEDAQANVMSLKIRITKFGISCVMAPVIATKIQNNISCKSFVSSVFHDGGTYYLSCSLPSSGVVVTYHSVLDKPAITYKTSINGKVNVLHNFSLNSNNITVSHPNNSIVGNCTPSHYLTPNEVKFFWGGNTYKLDLNLENKYVDKNPKKSLKSSKLTKSQQTKEDLKTSKASYGVLPSALGIIHHKTFLNGRVVLNEAILDFHSFSSLFYVKDVYKEMFDMLSNLDIGVNHQTGVSLGVCFQITNSITTNALVTKFQYHKIKENQLVVLATVFTSGQKTILLRVPSCSFFFNKKVCNNLECVKSIDDPSFSKHGFFPCSVDQALSLEVTEKSLKILTRYLSATVYSGIMSQKGGGYDPNLVREQY